MIVSPLHLQLLTFASNAYDGLKVSTYVLPTHTCVCVANTDTYASNAYDGLKVGTRVLPTHTCVCVANTDTYGSFSFVCFAKTVVTTLTEISVGSMRGSRPRFIVSWTAGCHAMECRGCCLLFYGHGAYKRAWRFARAKSRQGSPDNYMGWVQVQAW